MPSIFFIGMRGAGKTTLARELLFYFPEKIHIDIDAEIIKQEGETIAKIIKTKGIRYFRHKEEELLAQYTKINNAIISTGAGIVLSAKNRSLLKMNYTIFINSPIESLLERIKKDPQKNQRPPLTIFSEKEELLYLLEERKHFYLETAQYIFYNTFSLKKSAFLLYTHLKRKITKNCNS